MKNNVIILLSKKLILLFEFMKKHCGLVGKVFQLADFFHLAIFAKWKNVANWKNSPSVFRVILYWCEYKISENKLFCNKFRTLRSEWKNNGRKTKKSIFSVKLTFFVKLGFLKTDPRNRSFEGYKKFNSLIFYRVNHFYVLKSTF